MLWKVILNVIIRTKQKEFNQMKKCQYKLLVFALFHEDIAPNMTDIHSGKVTVFGKERDIIQGTKARNPDGTVNYIELDIV